MGAADILEKIGESLRSAATVRSVFGDPIHAEGKTVVPVAKVAYAFGAGAGTNPEKRDGEAEAGGEGGGGGGGVRAFPAGVLEITADQTRFIAFTDLRLLGTAFVAGALFAGLFFARRSR